MFFFTFICVLVFIRSWEILFVIKALNIGYGDHIGWGFFISDIGYRGRYRGNARISGIYIRHYIYNEIL